MQLYYPRSLLKLLLAGFSLAVLPLIFALINNAYSIHQLAAHSQRAVYQAVQTTQNTRFLIEQITSMERSIRQFAIIGDMPPPVKLLRRPAGQGNSAYRPDPDDPGERAYYLGHPPAISKKRSRPEVSARISTTDPMLSALRYPLFANGAKISRFWLPTSSIS